MNKKIGSYILETISIVGSIIYLVLLQNYNIFLKKTYYNQGVNIFSSLDAIREPHFISYLLWGIGFCII